MLGISGGLRIDHIITPEREARPRALGGNAVFAAVGARVWIDEVNIIARAGRNYPSEWVDLLQSRKLTTRGIHLLETVQDHRTFYAYPDANTRDDANPSLHYGAIGAVMPEELEGYVHSYAGQEDLRQIDPLAPIPGDLNCDVTAYHLAPMALRSHLDMPGAARARGATFVSLDPGERYMVPTMWRHVETILSQIDVFMPSAMEVASFFRFDNRNPVEMLRRMHWFADRGPRIVVFKLGTDGSLVYLRDDDRVWHFPAVPVRVVDVTGAGDSYCGGFAGSLSAHGDATEAAIAGTVAASFAIEDYGAMHVLDATQVMRDARTAWVRERMSQGVHGVRAGAIA